MKIRFTVGVAFGGKRHDSGAVADLPESDAKHFIGMGYAEPAGQEKRRRTTATRRAPRKAAAKPAPKSGK